MSPGIWQLLLVLVLVVVLFGGRGKISNVMGDMAKGIASFKKGLREEEEPTPSQRSIADGGETVDVSPEPKKPESTASES